MFHAAKAERAKSAQKLDCVSALSHTHGVLENGHRIGKSVIEMADKKGIQNSPTYVDSMAKSLTEKTFSNSEVSFNINFVLSTVDAIGCHCCCVFFRGTASVSKHKHQAIRSYLFPVSRAESSLTANCGPVSCYVWSSDDCNMASVSFCVGRTRVVTTHVFLWTHLVFSLATTIQARVWRRMSRGQRSHLSAVPSWTWWVLKRLRHHSIPSNSSSKSYIWDSLASEWVLALPSQSQIVAHFFSSPANGT